MNEERFFEQLVASQIGMHPLIFESELTFEEKLQLQMMLEAKFEGDMKAMILDVLQFMIEEEEYEFAAQLRDEFLNKL